MAKPSKNNPRNKLAIISNGETATGRLLDKRYAPTIPRLRKIPPIVIKAKNLAKKLISEMFFLFTLSVTTKKLVFYFNQGLESRNLAVIWQSDKI
jgi:hypothetical protein